MQSATAGACVFVVFGGTGDLMRRKLLPALSYLAQAKLLPDRCQILAVARDRELTDAGFRRWARETLAVRGSEVMQKAGLWCETCLHYQAIDETSAPDYERLAARIVEIERAHRLPGNRVFYLALPPAAFPGAIEALGKARLNRSKGWTRLVIEKPFGRDLASARRLNVLAHKYFNEVQVYRIDHYLGKETVQNLLAFRFGNALFESAWNRDHIESVQITVEEELGIGHRAAADLYHRQRPSKWKTTVRALRLCSARAPHLCHIPSQPPSLREGKDFHRLFVETHRTQTLLGRGLAISSGTTALAVDT